ncbi:Non-ous end-joining factor 1 [Desmophyllum pertusum]|uniref:Non-homologous end-joining factor 1 n=1 Tax=Desmophyllum pertusum TaxID=174260 RepID=A0A9W9YXE1_9CNID|nr:Non-ous end-joining factor 1 [Desmophyllum pertusum]
MAATVRRETSWRRRWKPDLNSQPWKYFSISDKPFLVKSMFVEMDCSYEFCMWDFSTFWYEKVEHDNFRVRAKELNPNVEAKLSYLLKFVQKSIEENNKKEEPTFTINEEAISDDKLIVKMKTKLQAGVPFVWEFHCSVGEKNMVGSQLVQPMLAMIVELNRRQAELCTLLRKKDQEIMDYKESGIRLSRKSLGTSEFNEDTFKSKMILSQGFEDAVSEAATKGFNDASCELYKQVMIKTAWLTEKDLPEPEEDDDDADDIYGSLAAAVGGPSAPSWTDVLPPSLLGKDDEPSTTSPRGSPRKTPVTSPAKSSGMSSPATSPSKDMELQRREALQKRLAEEAERKKKKKRKINL